MITTSEAIPIVSTLPSTQVRNAKAHPVLTRLPLYSPCNTNKVNVIHNQAQKISRKAVQYFCPISLDQSILVCCQHIDFWSLMWALFWYSIHRWAEQVLCIVTAQGVGGVRQYTHVKGSGAFCWGLLYSHYYGPSFHQTVAVEYFIVVFSQYYPYLRAWLV